MSLLNNNNKKGADKQAGNKNKAANTSSKFLKPSSKTTVAKKVRSTGANRGS